ncbi:MAG: glycosyltransferase family 4 protein [Actinomycetota bacterium]
MRLVFDSSPFRYDPATGRGPSGVAKWSLGALSELAKQNPKSELIGISPGLKPPTLPAASIGANVAYKTIPVPSRIHRVMELMRLQPPVERWVGGIDAVIGNAYIPPRTNKAPSVPIFYDMSVLTHPGMHPKQRVVYIGSQLRRVARSANVIVTISQSVRREIVEYFNVPPGRVYVAYPAWQPVAFPGNSAVGKAEDFQKTLPSEYLLFVGTIEPRKNIAGLVTVMANLKASRRDLPPLVLVGGQGWGEERFGEKLSELIASGVVIRVGYLPDNCMESVYRGALGLVYASLYEGFGMPIIEAMAYGCPVITSDLPSMKEVAGDAALLVDPNDHSQVEAAIVKIMDSEQSRSDLAAKGLVRAGDFSWDKTAASLQEAVEHAIEGN